MAGKVLVVEDHDKFAALLQSLLERSGFDVERAGDGIAALSAVARERPDAVLLDLRLPRLSGAEVLKKIRQAPATRELPVIVLSGAYRGEQNARAAREMGANAFLEKPCRPGQILQALGAVLRSPPTATEPNRQSFGDLLVGAFRAGYCGRYLLTISDSEHQLTLLNGIPLYLRPGFRCEDFGAHLQGKGLINEEILAYYRREARRDHFVFVQTGYLEYTDLLQEKMFYLTEELSSALQVIPEQVRRKEHAFPPGVQPITVNVPQILYQGHRRHLESWSELPHRTAHYAAPAGDFYRYINFMDLSFEDRQLLQRLDGRTRLEDCLRDHDNPAPLLKTLTDLGMLNVAETPVIPANPGELPLHRLFNSLAEEKEDAQTAEEDYESFDDLLEGAMDFAAPDEPEQAVAAEEPPDSSVGAQVRDLAEDLKGKNYYEMLGLSQQKFSFDTLKKNYFRLTRQLGPEVIMQLTGAEAALAEDLLSNISSAYNTLSDVVKKERYDEMLGSDEIGLGREGDDEFQAEVQFQSGKVFIDMEDWDGAEKALREACNADQGDGLALAHLAWAIYKNPKNKDSGAMRDKARQMLNRALTLDRTAEGFAFKGWMLLDGDQTSLAEAEFIKALKLNARNSMARKGLRRVQELREQEKKGLFRRMFS